MKWKIMRKSKERYTHAGRAVVFDDRVAIVRQWIIDDIS